MILGDVIRMLEQCDPNTVVPFGFHEPHSHRGNYSDLAFITKKNVKVKVMLDAARSAVGETYQGWNDGDYTMDVNSDVYLTSAEGNVGEELSRNELHLMLAVGTNPAPLTVGAERFGRNLRVPWFVVVNDVIGGWSISHVDKPLSQQNFQQGEGEIADFVSQEAAEHIVHLHNIWLQATLDAERDANLPF